MTEWISADPDALRRGGLTIDEVSALTRGICLRLLAAVEQYKDAGGTGEMGEAFATGYVPTAEDGVAFVKLLSEVVGEVGGKTVETARVLGDTSDEADTAATG
ncbi:hypothetical protein ACTG9Q_27605 [Actinokineospora sp. 24-640]